MPSNTAAWLMAEKATPFEIKEAPDWTPEENEILIKNHAVAINPVDGYTQALALFPMVYPTILGNDVAGEILDVGSKIQGFKKGDRVIGQAQGSVKNIHGKTVDFVRESGFQAYTILEPGFTSKIPDEMAYEDAVVLPCCFSTAASGLFQDAPYLQMQVPTEPAQKSTGKTVLIWGGASSVGSSGTQMAIAAGYEVITTASPRNFEYVKKLGASQVFDYNSTTVVQDILNACKGKIMAGTLDCVGAPATAACMEIMQNVEGNRAVSTVKPEPEQIPEGVSVKFIFGPSIGENEVGRAVWTEFLPKALESGSFVPAPEPLVIGKGLEKVQEGIDHVNNKGVSAKKVVITL